MWEGQIINHKEQTRQKLKEAYDIHFAAVIERAEKQILLARHGRRILNLLDDTPVVPGDTRPAFEHAHQARQVLHDAEEDLREWTPSLEPVPSSATDLGTNLMPTSPQGVEQVETGSPVQQRITGSEKGVSNAGQLTSTDSRDMSGSSTAVQPEPSTSYQQQ